MVTQEEVIEKLKTVIDPHIGADIHTLGLIKEIDIQGNDVKITFIPTSPFCPLGIELAQGIKNAAESIEGIKVTVKIMGHIQETMINEQINQC
ncbi:MAG: metal-sulfur cluster assembly factor [Candidatus Thermoplasmatota archaeon]|nr:metal-sulfur cluster assembly factor [Candidatus Thermoplasmatota archaeon]